MNELLDHIQFLLLGLGNGAVFAAIGLALVVTFRSSGVVNFAAGAMALYSAYTYAFLREGRLLSPFPGTPVFISVGADVGLGPALALSVLIATLLGLAAYVLVFRPLRHAPPLASAVASLGLMVVLQAVLAQRVGTRPVNVDPIFPRKTVVLGTATIQVDRVWFAATIVVVGLALALLFQRTSFGLMTRAASSTEKGAIVSGLAPDRIAAANWAVAAAVTGLSGILIAPIVPLVPVSYTLFVIPALAAALLSNFKALVPTVVGALILGMLQSEATYLQVRLDWLPAWVVPASGLPEMLPLALVLAVLLLRARPLVSRGVDLRETLGAAPRPRSVLVPSAVGVTVGMAAIFTFSSQWRLALITSMILAVISLSLVLVTGYGGQISLAQLTLAGVSGFLLTTFGDDWGVPFPISPLLAALGATVIGVAFGLPALRVRGLSLAIVTLALAAALEAVWFRNNEFNGGAGGARVSGPRLADIDLGVGAGLAFPREAFATLCLIVLAAAAVGVALVRRSRFGSWAMAVRVNERAAAAAGINVVGVKLGVFAMGAFLAGLGGALLTYKQGAASFDLFATLSGLGLFAIVYLAGITSVSGGIAAGLLAPSGVVFHALDEWVSLGTWYHAVTGLLLVVAVITRPEGIVGSLHTWRDRIRTRKLSPLPETVAGASTTVEASRARPLESPSLSGQKALSVESLSVRYGQVIAVDNVSFSVSAGSITGLIGPNGAGKTSLLDAITGFIPYSGQVRIPSGRIDGQPPHRRARSGVMRTFQAAQLCDGLTVAENITIGLAAGGALSNIESVVRVLGLEEVRSRKVADLSQGQRQMVALARSLARQPHVLLLDEPAGGLDSVESRWLGDRLRHLRDVGVTVVLVDHDMGLVLDVCDQILVLDFGVLIAAGTPVEVRRDPAVRVAYLGHTGVIS